MIDKLLRKVPRFKGKQRLARLLLRNNIINTKDLWIKGRQDCEFLLPNLIENVGFEIFINGIFEKETSDFFAKMLPENGVFLDLGANIGAISIPLVKKRPDIKAICVEAAPWIFEYLQKNIRRNSISNVVAFCNALFYSDNEELNFYSPNDKFGKGSFSPAFTDKALKVRTIKIDSLLKIMGLEKVDMIKIDIEGYEYQAFKGAINLFSKANAPDILFEFEDWAEAIANNGEIGAAQQILFDMGYRIYYFNNKLKSMKELNKVIKKGSYMLFATKNVHKIWHS